jgi:hypothetical protein
VTGALNSLRTQVADPPGGMRSIGIGGSLDRVFVLGAFWLGNEILTIGHHATSGQFLFHELALSLSGFRFLELPVNELGLESTVFLDEVFVAPPLKVGSSIAVGHDDGITHTEVGSKHDFIGSRNPVGRPLS